MTNPGTSSSTSSRWNIILIIIILIADENFYCSIGRPRSLPGVLSDCMVLSQLLSEKDGYAKSWHQKRGRMFFVQRHCHPESHAT